MNFKNIPCQTLHTLTKDGWKIALHHYSRADSTRSSVLLAHGLATNRHYFDFPLEEKSFAKYLWGKGWDTWVIDFRGAGQSTKPQGLEWFTKKWSFDHYIHFDLPAAIGFILEKTGKPKLHWIGHSLGGVMVYPYVKTFSEKNIQSVVLLGTPLAAKINPSVLKWVSWAGPLIRLFPFIPYRSLFQLYRLQPRWMRGIQKWAHSRKIPLDTKTIQIGYQKAIEDIPSEVFYQVLRWLQCENFSSSDGKSNYWFPPKNFKLPLLVLTGAADPFTPPHVTGPIFEKFGSQKKKWVIFGKARGFKTDYGHIDLILGKNAPQEVYPVITEWLAENENSRVGDQKLAPPFEKLKVAKVCHSGGGG